MDPLIVLFGLGVGILVGTTGMGGGSLIAVVLIAWFQLTPRRVVGTDVFHAAVLLWVAGTAHIFSGNVDFGLAGNILIGSVPGVWIGAGLAQRLPENGLRPALGFVLLASGLALLSKAGASIPAGVIFGVPIALAVVGLPFLRARAARARADRPAARVLAATEAP